MYSKESLRYKEAFYDFVLILIFLEIICKVYVKQSKMKQTQSKEREDCEFEQITIESFDSFFDFIYDTLFFFKPYKKHDASWELS